MGAVQHVVAGILSAAILGLAAWIYHVGERQAAGEAVDAAMRQEVHEIHEDVRELRRVLIDRK